MKGVFLIIRYYKDASLKCPNVKEGLFHFVFKMLFFLKKVFFCRMNLGEMISHSLTRFILSELFQFYFTAIICKSFFCWSAACSSAEKKIIKKRNELCRKGFFSDFVLFFNRFFLFCNPSLACFCHGLWLKGMNQPHIIKIQIISLILCYFKLSKAWKQ